MFYVPEAKETTTTTGTGNVTCAAVTGFDLISSNVKVGDTFPGVIKDANGNREEGIYTLVSSGPDVIARTTVGVTTIGGTPGYGTAITLSSGTHTVFCSQTADGANKNFRMAHAFIDYVVSGLALPATSGTLSGTIGSGIAYVVGQGVFKGAFTRTYTASKDTYVDLGFDGTYTFSEVANGASAPTVTANSHRLGFVTTGASTITSATTLANPYRIPVCMLLDTAPGTYTGSAWAAVTFASASKVLVDNAGMHSILTNTSRITVPSPGLYMATVNVAGGTSGSDCYAAIVKNGASVVAPGANNFTTGVVHQGQTDGGLSKSFLLNAADYLEFYFYPPSSWISGGLVAFSFDVIKLA